MSVTVSDSDTNTDTEVSVLQRHDIGVSLTHPNQN